MAYPGAFTVHVAPHCGAITGGLLMVDKKNEPGLHSGLPRGFYRPCCPAVRGFYRGFKLTKNISPAIPPGGGGGGGGGDLH